MTSIAIVIVNYNGRVLLPACLDPTLEQARVLGAQVVVVDNASADGSADFVSAHYPDVVLIRAPQNLGFAEGCNVGARAVPSDIVVLLNNDAVPRPGWLANLIAPLLPGGRSRVAIVSAVIREERYADAYALGTGSLSVIGHPIPNVARDVTQPFYATGCALAFRRAAFPEPFDPEYFAYYEDVLLSWQARLRGFDVVRALDAEVDHLGSATARRQPARMRFYWERNKLLTLLLCYERATVLRLVPLYVFDAIVRVAEDIWRQVRRRPGTPTLADVAGGYLATLRGVGWLMAHWAAVAQKRAAVQRGRHLPDTAITVRLSGKLFDDLVPTRGHTVANVISQAYCRLVGIRVAEATTGPDRPQSGTALAPLALSPTAPGLPRPG